MSEQQESLHPNQAPLTEAEHELRERLWQIGFQIIEDAPQLHISYDIEADGDMFGLGSVLSLGGVAPNGNTFYRELKPLFPDKFNPGKRKFCKDHGLDVEQLMKSGTDPQEATVDFAAWVNQQAEETGKEPLMVGVAIAWDWAHTRGLFAYYGIEDPFGEVPKPLDICGVAFSGIAGHDMKQTGKNKLPRFIWPDQDFPHHALGDSEIQGFLHAGVEALDEALRNPDMAAELGLEPALRARGFNDLADRM
jgi:hypothetical protein